MFDYTCLDCGHDFAYSRGIDEPGPEACPSCGLPNVVRAYTSFPSVSARALATKGAAVQSQLQTDTNLGYDLPAYRRLRDNGLQPKKIDGSHELERTAETSMEVEMGHLFNDPTHMRKAKEGMDMAAEVREAQRDQGLIRDLP